MVDIQRQHHARNHRYQTIYVITYATTIETAATDGIQHDATTHDATTDDATTDYATTYDADSATATYGNECDAD